MTDYSHLPDWPDLAAVYPDALPVIDAAVSNALHEHPFDLVPRSEFYLLAEAITYRVMCELAAAHLTFAPRLALAPGSA